jgi:hypothetical protein
MKYERKPNLFYIKRAIEENDDPDEEYKHDQVKQIYVAYYYGNPMFPGDCWIADYSSGGISCMFNDCYDTLEEFWEWNDCFSKDIIHIDFEEGIA